VVNHPERWNGTGFKEIQEPPKRYAIIDLQSLSELSGFTDLRDFQRAHRQWVEQALEHGLTRRDDRWSESIAVGSLAFIDQVKNELGFRVEPVQIVQTVQPLRSVQNALQANTKGLGCDRSGQDITRPPFLLKDDHIRTAQG
jgi:hypothetical protein